MLGLSSGSFVGRGRCAGEVDGRGGIRTTAGGEEDALVF